MKFRKITPVILAAGFIVLGITGAVLYKKERGYCQVKISELERALQRIKQINVAANSFINITIKDEGKTLPISDLFGSHLLNDNLKEQEIGTSLLVVRFSELHCESCIKNLITTIQSTTSNEFSSRVFLLSDFSNPIHLESFCKRLPKDFPIKNYKRNISNLESDKVGLPYLFVLDRNGTVRNIHFHLKEDANRTKEYLNAVQQHILQN